MRKFALYGKLLTMLESEINSEDCSYFELLKTLLRSPKNAESIAKEFAIEMLVDTNRQELGLTKVSFDRLMAAIELGRRVHESQESYKAAKQDQLFIRRD